MSTWEAVAATQRLSSSDCPPTLWNGTGEEKKGRATDVHPRRVTRSTNGAMTRGQATPGRTTRKGVLPATPTLRRTPRRPGNGRQKTPAVKASSPQSHTRSTRAATAREKSGAQQLEESRDHRARARAKSKGGASDSAGDNGGTRTTASSRSTRRNRRAPLHSSTVDDTPVADEREKHDAQPDLERDVTGAQEEGPSAEQLAAEEEFLLQHERNPHRKILRRTMHKLPADVEPLAGTSNQNDAAEWCIGSALVGRSPTRGNRHAVSDGSMHEGTEHPPTGFNADRTATASPNAVLSPSAGASSPADGKGEQRIESGAGAPGPSSSAGEGGGGENRIELDANASVPSVADGEGDEPDANDESVLSSDAAHPILSSSEAGPDEAEGKGPSSAVEPGDAGSPSAANLHPAGPIDDGQRSPGRTESGDNASSPLSVVASPLVDAGSSEGDASESGANAHPPPAAELQSRLRHVSIAPGDHPVESDANVEGPLGDDSLAGHSGDGESPAEPGADAAGGSPMASADGAANDTTQLGTPQSTKARLAATEKRLAMLVAEKEEQERQYATERATERKEREHDRRRLQDFESVCRDLYQRQLDNESNQQLANKSFSNEQRSFSAELRAVNKKYDNFREFKEQVGGELANINAKIDGQEEFKDQVGDELANINAKADRLEGRVDKNEDTVDDLGEELQDYRRNQEERTKTLEGNQEKLEVRVDSVETEVGVMEKRLDKYEAELTTFRTMIEGLGGEMDDAHDFNGQIEMKYEDLKAAMANLQGNFDQLKSMRPKKGDGDVKDIVALIQSAFDELEGVNALENLALFKALVDAKKGHLVAPSNIVKHIKGRGDSTTPTEQEMEIIMLAFLFGYTFHPLVLGTSYALKNPSPKEIGAKVLPLLGYKERGETNMNMHCRTLKDDKRVPTKREIIEGKLHFYYGRGSEPVEMENPFPAFTFPEPQA